MTMYAYPAAFVPEGKAITVTFPDLPEAVTNGYTEAEAVEYAADALTQVLQEYMRRKRRIPRPSKRKRGMRLICLPAVVQAKLELYSAMNEVGFTKAELSRRLKAHKFQVERLLDLRHSSRMDQIESALALIGKRVAIVTWDAA